MLRHIHLAMTNETHPGADITEEQWQFIQAIEAYKRRFQRRYPTWREVLHVARCLGYRRIAKATALDQLPVDDLVPPSEDVLAELQRQEGVSGQCEETHTPLAFTHTHTDHSHSTEVPS